ncbi:hypothetical protein [uncultured Paludibaculum sp.]|uniref:DUF4097 family beta strand repeat-containing protein n=1 Tax=uncultured Paludibaculum sp. TaxID=1765020 RepID=UPI002AAC3930|nr:hypothetical protein [uncultured Paludibaculum sp.]
MTKTMWVSAIAVAAVALPMWGQDKLTVPLSDPSRPATLRASLLTGSIRVKGYSGKDVIVEAKTRQEKPSEPAQKDGMRRIQINSTGLEVEEENNNVRVGASAMHRAVDIEIQVPMKTSLKLKTVNDGEIIVEGVQGDVEVSDINGPVTLTGISGSVVAHSLNDKVKVIFSQVDPQKPMSFSSLNGDIDVTFPASVKANVKLKTQRGDVYSDFDLVVTAAPKATTEPARTEKGKYRVKLDQSLYGTINGGGPEMQFSNFNGSIYIRKAGK